jgi:hypothetical protein
MGMVIWWRIMKREGEEEAEHCVPPAHGRINSEAERNPTQKAGSETS